MKRITSAVLAVALGSVGTASYAGDVSTPPPMEEAQACSAVSDVFVSGDGFGGPPPMGPRMGGFQASSAAFSPLGGDEKKGGPRFPFIAVDMEAGDQMLFVTSGPVGVGVRAPDADPTPNIGSPFTASTDGVHFFDVLSGRVLEGPDDMITVFEPEVLSEDDLLIADTPIKEVTPTGATFTCVPGGGEAQTDPTGATGITATRLKSNSVNERGRIGRGTTVTTNLSTEGGNAFLGQQGDDGWTAWVAVELRKFTGDYEGNAFNLAGGADYQMTAATAVGAMISFGSSDLDGGFGDFEAKSRGFGPYFLHEFGNGLSAEGFLTYEKVTYDITVNEFDAKRIAYGLTLLGSTTMGGLDVTPFLRLEGFNEDQDAYGLVAANDVTYRTLSAGARVDFDMGDVSPYLSLALENRRLTSDNSPDENFNAPRLGFGFDYAPTATSRLSVDVDAGKVLEDTRDYGLIFTYEVDF